MNNRMEEYTLEKISDGKGGLVATKEYLGIVPCRVFESSTTNLNDLYGIQLEKSITIKNLTSLETNNIYKYDSHFYEVVRTKRKNGAYYHVMGRKKIWMILITYQKT